LLCGSAWRRFHDDISARFEELRELCAQAGDKPSLAVGTAGLVLEHIMQGRVAEASQLASECMALVESLGDLSMIVQLSFALCVAKIQAAEWDDAMRWSHTVIGLADVHRANANFLVGSPVAAALVFRGVARWRLGRDGWREDLDRAVAMARTPLLGRRGSTTGLLSGSWKLPSSIGRRDSSRSADGTHQHGGRALFHRSLCTDI